jgi:acetyl esterase/lipase
LKKSIFLLLTLFYINNLTHCQTVIIDGIPRDTSFTLYQTYNKEKKGRPYIQPVYAHLPENEIAYEKIVYKTIKNKSIKNEHRQLHLNIYRPKNKKLYPALLMIHGGGWNSGNLSLQIPLAQHIAEKGYVTVPVEYRLIPEALYPAGVNDLEDALKWIYKNATKYGIDKNKIAVSGCSAGGQLACLLGTRNISGYVKAIINIDGISTFLDSTSIDRAQKAREKGLKLPVDALWLGGTYAEKAENWRKASALTYVSKRSAPVCFINSSNARFHNGRDEMVQKLRKLGINTEIHTLADTPHPFWFFEPWHHQTVEYAVNFLNKTFK